LPPSSPGCEPAALKLVGELERYEDSYRLCYVRPEGIIELAEARSANGSKAASRLTR